MTDYLKQSLFVIVFAFCLAAGVSAQPPIPSQPPIAYEIKVDESRNQRLYVRITAGRPAASTLSLAIPAWTPGYYQILHYEKNIERVHAEDENGHALTVNHSSPRQWKISWGQSTGRQLRFSYEVKSNDKGYGFFGTSIDTRRKLGYVNGASALMYLVGAAQLPVSLAVNLPTGWKCATSLDKDSHRSDSNVSLIQNNSLRQRKLPEREIERRDAPLRFAPGEQVQPVHSQAAEIYRAANYDELIDCPMQIGQFDSFDFQVNAIPFQCIVVGEHPIEKAKLTDKLIRIATTTIALFGSAPFQRYIFFYHIGEEGFVGGLEHRSSTVIHLDDPINDGEDDDFLTTTAHELFHAWNVKKIHPTGLGPFDYSQPVRVSSLWFAEGVTDYYADLLPVRAGLRTSAWFLQQLSVRIRQLDTTPSRLRVSAEEASRKAWEGQSEGYGGLSYYLKGSLIGCWFDLRIRELSQGTRSLDDVMRDLDRRYGQRNLPYPDTTLLTLLSAVAGRDLTEEYNRYVRSVEDFEWEEVFPSLGWNLQRQRDGFLGVSFLPDVPFDETDDSDDTDRIAVVQKVEAGFPAEKMGLRTGDRILSINGREVTYGLTGAIIRSLPALTPVTITVQRNEKRLILNGVTAIQFSHHVLTVLPDDAQNETVRRLQSDLFSQKTVQTPASSPVQ